MTAPELLSTLHRRGAVLRACGDRLRVEAPPGTVTDDILAALKAQKPTILRFLQAAPAEQAVSRELYAEAWAYWYEYFLERASIREYAGGQTREHAEAEAWPKPWRRSAGGASTRPQESRRYRLTT